MRNLKDRDGLGQIQCDMDHMCETIGRRLAGSPEEERTADYMIERMQDLGLVNTEKLPFAMRRWFPEPAELVRDDGKAVVVQHFTHSKATPPEGVEGELVVFEPVDYEDGLKIGDLDGKIGLFHGGYGERADFFREMHDSGLAALLFVDTRLQTAWAIANGMGERYMKLVKKPMASVSLMDAWALVRDGVKRVRLTCSGHAEDATSWNAVGELPGADPAGKVIVVCGHLDSVSVGVGADDNASGIAATLECARRLRDRDLKHTVRFIGFGCEEQLSVGSMRYVNEQIADLDRVAFVSNFDGIGAHLGLSTALCTGTPAMDEYVRAVVESRMQFGNAVVDACPYQDMFPFAAKGAPGIWLTRKTDLNHYWYHHSVHNDLAAVSMEQIAWMAEAACEMVGDLATRDDWPFAREVAPDLREKCDEYLRELF